MDLSSPRRSSPSSEARGDTAAAGAMPGAVPGEDGRALVRCIVAGVVLGAAAALVARQPVLLCALIGSVAGALVGWAMAGLERDRGLR